MYTWVSASESGRWQEVVREFTSRIHALGPAPRISNTLPEVLSQDGLFPQEKNGVL